jgi:hypothetical protein
MKSLTIYWNALTEGFWAAKCAFEMVFADRLKNPDKPHLCIATCRRMDDGAELPASLSSLSREILIAEINGQYDQVAIAADHYRFLRAMEYGIATNRTVRLFRKSGLVP